MKELSRTAHAPFRTLPYKESSLVAFRYIPRIQLVATTSHGELYVTLLYTPPRVFQAAAAEKINNITKLLRGRYKSVGNAQYVGPFAE